MLDFFGEDMPALTRGGYIDVDPFTFETSIPGVYAGGDVALDGPSSIVKAAADGKPLRFEISVVAGWSDWITASKFLAAGLERIGRPRAVRAVGAANGRNPIPIIVPCHRVIGSHGDLTGFGGGLDTKEALLRLEAEHSCFPNVV